MTRAALDRARRSRDARFDGKFYIAVRSTRIYCRPICPSRLSQNSNVHYYPTAAAAAEAGYRPCLRCRPEVAPGTPAWQGTSAVVRRALRLIGGGALDSCSVEALATRLGIGARHLHRLLVGHVGASPIAIAQTRRLHFAKRLLDETTLPITEIAMAAGFGSIRQFNDVIRGTYRRSPSQLRRRRAPVSASDEIRLALPYREPYDWHGVCQFLARRALPGVELVDERGYSRTIRVPGGHALMRVFPASDAKALTLSIHGAASKDLFELSSTARRMFDTAADPARIQATYRADPLLGPLVKRRPGLRIVGAWDPFECAVRAILGQHTSVAASRMLCTRLVLRFGERIAPDASPLTHLFPSPAALACNDLSGIGMSPARAGAIAALSRAVLSGQIRFDGLPEEVQRALTALPGITDRIGQYVALRALGEPDAFLSGDHILRAGASTDKRSLTAQQLAKRAEAWRPWRGYAVFYLWNAATMRAWPPSLCD